MKRRILFVCIGIVATMIIYQNCSDVGLTNPSETPQEQCSPPQYNIVESQNGDEYFYHVFEILEDSAPRALDIEMEFQINQDPPIRAKSISMSRDEYLNRACEFEVKAKPPSCGQTIEVNQVFRKFAAQDPDCPLPVDPPDEDPPIEDPPQDDPPEESDGLDYGFCTEGTFDWPDLTPANFDLPSQCTDGVNFNIEKEVMQLYARTTGIARFRRQGSSSGGNFLSSTFNCTNGSESRIA